MTKKEIIEKLATVSPDTLNPVLQGWGKELTQEKAGRLRPLGFLSNNYTRLKGPGK